MDSSTIKEKNLDDYPIPITSEETRIILKQMEKNVCKIYLDNGIKGTGFFCKIPYPDKEHLLSVLVTNNHIIDEAHLRKNNKIIFSINNDKIKKQLIIGDRIVYTSKLYDITIIQIHDKDDINDFLELDFDINEEYLENMLVKKSVYILHYPNNEKISVSYGIINGINLQKSWEVFHFCSTDKGSSGAPILNITNNKLIGIHKGAINNLKFNKGTALILPFKEFISQKKKEEIIVHEKKFILKNKVKEVIYQPSSLFVHSAEMRIRKEMNDNEINDCNNEGYQVFGLIDNKLYGVLEGPPNTIYENGFFQFMMELHKNYPFNPPKFFFQTKIFHPNIYEDSGLVSVDILQNEWNMALTFDTIIYSVQSLLDDPNIYIFVNEKAAKLYKENKKAYEKTVREWTNKYANFNIVQNELKKYNFQMEFNI